MLHIGRWTEGAFVNRDYILENNVIGRYVAGELSEREAEQFEFAFFQDEELAALVEAEQTLQREFGKKPQEESPAAGFEDQTVASRSYRWIGAAAAALVIGALPLLYFYGDRTATHFALSTTAPASTNTVTYLESGERGGAGSTTIAIPSRPDDTVVLSFPIEVDDPLQLSLAYEDDIDPIWTTRWQRNGASPVPLFLSIAATEVYPGNYTLTVRRVDDDTTVAVFRFRATQAVF